MSLMHLDERLFLLQSYFHLKIYFIMATSNEEFSTGKRKRDTNEEETLKMDTEQNTTAQFPQINPSQLKVKFEYEFIGSFDFIESFLRKKQMVFVKYQYLHIVIHH